MDRISYEQAEKLRKYALKGMSTWWCGEDFALDMMRKYKVFEYWDIEDLQYRPINYEELDEFLEWAYEDFYGDDL